MAELIENLKNVVTIRYRKCCSEFEYYTAYIWRIEHSYLHILIINFKDFYYVNKPVLQYAMSVVGSDCLLHVSRITQKTRKNSNLEDRKETNCT